MVKRTSEIKPPDEKMLNVPDAIAFELKDDGVIPNSKLPALFYRNVVAISEDDLAVVFQRLFEGNGWNDTWRNGIYTYHHYHSTAHEVLGIYRGSASVQLGGEHGIIQEVRAGDVIVIPAGVAHKNLGSSRDFGVVGAYPYGQDWDMNYGKRGERPRTDENIARVSLPKMDPVYGTAGPLIDKWRATR